MPKTKDITGQRFCWLVALKPIKKRKHNAVVWKCKCDCGNICFIKATSLTTGHTKSCGCKNTKNIYGMKFGRLTAIKPTGATDKNGLKIWLFKCDCGGFKEANINVIGNQVRSCGCLKYATYLIKKLDIKTEDVPIELVKIYMENRKLIKILKQKGSANK